MTAPHRPTNTPFDFDDAVIVVTGGGSGIGAALCERFAAESPAAIVVADLSVESAERSAEAVRELAGPTEVQAVGIDMADATQVTELVHAVQQRHGTIDLFCSNAGIATGAGVEAPIEVWERIWQVNVMAHVHVSNALLPQWTDRGRGHLMITASAAGLLTNLGDAPYSVTKHGAVALAEWLAITYGGRGIAVSCLCPQGVRTPLLFGDASPGSALAAEVVKAQRIIEPSDVADAAVAALVTGEFLILPHAEVADYEQARASGRARWIAAMRKLQARITDAAEGGSADATGPSSARATGADGAAATGADRGDDGSAAAGTERPVAG